MYIGRLMNLAGLTKINGSWTLISIMKENTVMVFHLEVAYHSG